VELDYCTGIEEEIAGLLKMMNQAVLQKMAGSPHYVGELRSLLLHMYNIKFSLIAIQSTNTCYGTLCN
jgi:hypothetical protein